MATTSATPAGLGTSNGHEINVPGLDLMMLSDDLVPEACCYFAALRAAVPIHRNSEGSLMATSDDVVVPIFRNLSVWNADKKIDFKPKFGNSLLYEHHKTGIVYRDPTDHRRIRKLFQAASLAPALSRTLRTFGV
jgi:hypothetical protein